MDLEPGTREALGLHSTQPAPNAKMWKHAMEFPWHKSREAGRVGRAADPSFAVQGRRQRSVPRTDEALNELERLSLKTPDSTAYYCECMLPAARSRHRDRRMPIDPINVIAMQIQLMEDTYFSLRLDQYANARDNRGWMNLFRPLGGVPRVFNGTSGCSIGTTRTTS